MNNGSQSCSEGRSLYDFHVEERDKIILGKGVYVSTTNETSKLANDHPIVKCESAGAESYVDCSGSMEPNCEDSSLEINIFPAKVLQDYPKGTKSSPGNQMDMQGIEIEHKKPFSEWRKFTCKDSGLLNPHSPAMESHYEKQQANIDESQKTESLCPLKCSDNNGGTAKSNETSQVPDVRARVVLAGEVVHSIKTDLDDKSSTQHQQTTGSHFLVSEMSGSHYRKLLSNPAGCSPASNSVASPKASKECLVANKPGSAGCGKFPSVPSGIGKSSLLPPGISVASPNSVASPKASKECLVANEPGSGKFPSLPPGIGKFSSLSPGIGKSSSLPPGIGLHLNTRAVEGGVKISEKRQKLAFRRHVTSSPCNLSSLNSEKESLNPPLASEVVERASEVPKANAELNKNSHETFTLGEGVGFLQNSPIRKRGKSNGVGETDSCRRCSCKRSKCLKLYCQCFEAGMYCTEPCNCQDCFNNPAHEDTVLETRRQIEVRKPLAYAPKVIRSGTAISKEESNKTPVLATYKKGCNCKKSGCQKKYCECYQRDVGCSLSCRCESCKNTFGRREGIEDIVYEESKTLKECPLDVSSHCEVPKADNENQATCEHLNNSTRSASALTSLQTVPSIMHKSTD